MPMDSESLGPGHWIQKLNYNWVRFGFHTDFQNARRTRPNELLSRIDAPVNESKFRNDQSLTLFVSRRVCLQSPILNLIGRLI